MIDIENIRNGSLNGQIIWICDLRYSDYNNKPIRNIAPTKVMVRSNSLIKKTIYYSESHFAKLNAAGEPLKSGIIPLFDNTGYRSYAGVALNCFEAEEECVAHYQKQLKTAIEGLEKYKIEICKSIDIKITELNKQLNGII